MKYYYKLVILVLFFFIISCKSNYIYSEKKIKKCSESNYNKSFLDVYGYNKNIDFYKQITSIEDIFILKGLIKNNSKKEYLLFIDKLQELKKETAIELIDEVNIHLKKQGIPKFEDFILISGVFNCPIDAYYSKNIKNKYPVKIIVYSYGIFRDDSYNQNNAIRDMFILIENEDFNKIVFRSFYILEIYRVLLNKKNSKGSNGTE